MSRAICILSSLSVHAHVGFRGAGFQDLSDQRQVNRSDEKAGRIVDVIIVAKDHALNPCRITQTLGSSR